MDAWNDWRRSPGRVAVVVALTLVAALVWNVIAAIGIGVAAAIALDPRTTARRR